MIRWQDNEHQALIPMRLVGPVSIVSRDIHATVPIPLATLESPLWPSTHRGAKLTARAGGIKASVIDERMTRSILVEADSVSSIEKIKEVLASRQSELQALVAQTSRFAQLINFNTQLVGCLLYIRFEFLTGDAAGHNMVTLASEKLLTWLLTEFPALRHVSVSGNYCTDKKVSAVNAILGRGKNVIAEALISHKLCQRYLHTTPQAIVELNIKKNLIGSIISGGVRSANAHFANMLLAFFLATGQDAANIVEGSQGIVHAELRNQSEDLYFSVTLPNLILGTVGNGKELPYVQSNLDKLGCLVERSPGANARRLAVIAASVVLCGELSLLAAQTKSGELMKSHVDLERRANHSR